MNLEREDAAKLPEILARMPVEDREVIQRIFAASHENAMRSTVAAIMARNFSHNIGPKVGSKKVKK